MSRDGGMYSSRAIRVFNILIISLLSACSNSPYVPVSEHRQPPSTALYQHRVARGETLFAIAWRYGLDYKSLAKINSISPPYTIYPGQVLSLKARERKPWSKARSSAVSPATVSKSSSSSARSKKQTSEVKKASSKAGYSSKFQWRWPHSGPVIARYSHKSPVNKGIDIGGKKGESVITAAPGRVVYSGDGLRGYGKLVIIKHNANYLSAYAHNSRILVKESQVVKAGQKIAEMGSSGTDKTKLHFEIRRDGKPVDPLKYLPRR